TTIILHKPGQPDYSTPKAYQPIALLDTLAKILSLCVTKNLTFLAETHNLLPPTHFHQDFDTCINRTFLTLPE
ncbi:hypothetical protein CONPUDRAFT_62821, partial [Coniophora puteana RWD-64-598 SS2]